MADQSGNGIYSFNAYDYANLGTAAGTTTLSNVPSFVHSISILNPAVAGTAVIYDSTGTSGTVIGTIINAGLGTVVPQLPVLDVRTRNGLTVVNTANMNILVSYLS